MQFLYGYEIKDHHSLLCCLVQGVNATSWIFWGNLRGYATFLSVAIVFIFHHLLGQDDLSWIT